MLAPLKIEHQVGMYGNCRDINAYAGELFFGRAHYSAGERIWYVSIHNRDGSVSEYNIHHSDGDDRSVAQVDAIVRLSYGSNYQRVAA
jgi:hypothetical protein